MSVKFNLYLRVTSLDIMTSSPFATLALISVAVVYAASPTTHVTHERRDIHSHSHREKRNSLEPHDIIPVRIGVSQCNLDRGYDLLLDVSDPDFVKYGKHWTAEQVAKMFSPSHESIELIREWLTGSGISEDRIVHSLGYEWIHFNATVQEAEELFQTEYHAYQFGLETRSTVGCDEYVLLLPRIMGKKQRGLTYILLKIQSTQPSREIY